jgi:hypothetical protein
LFLLLETKLIKQYHFFHVFPTLAPIIALRAQEQAAPWSSN